MAPLTPLLRPDRFFADREFHMGRLFALFGLLLVAGPAAVYGIGWVVTDHVDGTVLVDNPERPPDWYCDGVDDDRPTADRDRCDEPRQVERNVDAIFWDVVDRYVGPAALAYPLALLVFTLLLHGGAWLVGADGDLLTTAAITAWGMAPSLLAIPVSLAGLALVLDPVTVAPGDDPAAASATLAAQIERLEPFSTVSTVVVAVWGAIIWRSGLSCKQGLPGIEATLIAGCVAAIAAAAGLL